MSTDGKPVIQTVGLTKIFKDFWYRNRVVAVDRLDIEIYGNEVFGLLGPNGSGKSTTIKMMLGLLYPTRGRISVLSKAPTDVAIKSRIGYLPEESYLYRFLNARETLDYYGQLFQIARQDRRRRVEQLLEMVGLTREARRRVGEYSKGMARRIGLAQALINDPELLILDEPTTGLDPIGTREIKDLILFLNREKRKTILLCSHLLADVEDVCRRVTVLYGGRRQAMGYTHDLLRQEDLTQITTDKLSDDTVGQIRQLVEDQAHQRVISITEPKTRLETFFLKTVQEAQAIRPETSGVLAGGKIADFLAGSQQEEAVVESLIAAAQRPTPAAEPTPPSAKPQAEAPSTDVISSLVSAKPASEPGIESPLSQTPPAEDEHPDRSLIDRLVQRAEPTTDDPKE